MSTRPDKRMPIVIEELEFLTPFMGAHKALYRVAESEGVTPRAITEWLRNHQQNDWITRIRADRAEYDQWVWEQQATAKHYQHT